MKEEEADAAAVQGEYFVLSGTYVSGQLEQQRALAAAVALGPAGSAAGLLLDNCILRQYVRHAQLGPVALQGARVWVTPAGHFQRAAGQGSLVIRGVRRADVDLGDAGGSGDGGGGGGGSPPITTLYDLQGRRLLEAEGPAGLGTMGSVAAWSEDGWSTLKGWMRVYDVDGTTLLYRAEFANIGSMLRAATTVRGGTQAIRMLPMPLGGVQDVITLDDIPSHTEVFLLNQSPTKLLLEGGGVQQTPHAVLPSTVSALCSKKALNKHPITREPVCRIYRVCFASPGC